jgi:hypothetical protein
MVFGGEPLWSSTTPPSQSLLKRLTTQKSASRRLPGSTRRLRLALQYIRATKSPRKFKIAFLLRGAAGAIAGTGPLKGFPRLALDRFCAAQQTRNDHPGACPTIRIYGEGLPMISQVPRSPDMIFGNRAQARG